MQKQKAKAAQTNAERVTASQVLRLIEPQAFELDIEEAAEEAVARIMREVYDRPERRRPPQ